MNNFNNNWGASPAYGFGYNQAPRKPELTNPLTPENLALLKQKNPQFSLAVSQVDNLQAICTHRDKNGDTLVRNSDGSVTCTMCNTTFTPVNADPEAVQQVFKSVIDCLETMKIMYLDIPDEVTKAYFQMIPYLEKGPQLFKIAQDHFNRYNGATVMANNYNNGNAFAMYSAMFNPGMAMGMGMPQQQTPYYGFGQQPMMQPGMAPMQPPVQDVTMNVPNGANPFDAASPAVDSTKAQVTDNKQYSL